MEITKNQLGNILELKVKGRLDAYWADHLSSELEDVIREGAHNIVLDLANVSYMSSAGIRVLLSCSRQLAGIRGTFGVYNPSESIKKVLELVGLESLLVSKLAQPTPKVASKRLLRLERANADFEIFPTGQRHSTLVCHVVGEPELLIGARFCREHMRTISFPPFTFALGLGAFGDSFADCQNRFGEFLAVAGATAYLPTDGTNIPDYMVSAGSLVPTLQTLYCISCDGQFSHLARFEGKEDTGSIRLSELVDSCMEIAGADILGLVIIAESAGLVGAALHRSPAINDSEAAPLEHPQIRKWMTFTSERVHTRSLALIVGVATRNGNEALQEFIRPLEKGAQLAGHFHAAAFSYRPLQKGKIELGPTVNTLFEAESLQSLLHLLEDDREIVGIGQSEFISGACWMAPVSHVAVGKE